MHDNDCIRFLQWSLPQLQMRWSGFRRVHKQVCKRLAARLAELNVDNIAAYQNHLTQHPDEWQTLDTLCRVVVTRFYRDKMVFGELMVRVLPQLAEGALTHGRMQLRAWSIGSASGEEPYSVAILWQQHLASQFSPLQLSIVGTEVDSYLLERSRHACYAPNTLKNLPDEMRYTAFIRTDDRYCLKPLYQTMVEFRQQDIRTTLPDEHFDLILCRNLVFTYFDETQQQLILKRVLSRLVPEGWLLLGVHETLPAGSGLQAISKRLGLYQSIAS